MPKPFKPASSPVPARPSPPPTDGRASPSLGGPLAAKLAAIISGDHHAAPGVLDAVLDEALAQQASDVHLEPQDETVFVRFRVDGVLHDVGQLPLKAYGTLLNRIKVESKLRTDEHASAQDGTIRRSKGDQDVDVRVSIIPIIDGEKVVMRLLARYLSGLSLTDLGFSDAQRAVVERAARRPFGMLLTTGPTGSGKTTTLYALMKLLNDPGVNITTIEDPVEYKLPRVNHIQVNTATELTFARGLRSIVRQDPDIILVGEIRDAETAEISVNAALTGHLLFSSFHANDAATSIPRLLEMEIEPFLLASTLNLIVAQRLARRICNECQEQSKADPATLAATLPGASQYFGTGPVTLARGRGCPACGNTGYRGRTAFFELIELTDELRELILKRPSAREVWGVAQQQGATSMFEDGLAKVKAGVTTLEELLRVVAPPREAQPAPPVHADRRSP